MAAVYVHFSSDEMMNVYRYWELRAWKVIWADVLFWRKTIRPMASLYYLPLFHMFDLNPWPYTVESLALVLLDSLLLVRLAARIIGSLSATTLVVLVIAYHPDLASLTHNGSFIYDLLCAAFYFGAFVYYLRCRDSGFRLTLCQSCAFLAHARTRRQSCALWHYECLAQREYMFMFLGYLRLLPVHRPSGVVIAARCRGQIHQSNRDVLLAGAVLQLHRDQRDGLIAGGGLRPIWHSCPSKG